MTEDFIMEVEKRCKWISDEVKNFRHSDICRLNYCITWANDLLKLLEDKEEELEGMN